MIFRSARALARSRQPATTHFLTARFRHAHAASMEFSAPQAPPNASGSIRPFALEQYFVKYEFCTKYLMCVSDCESMTVAELLKMAGPEERRLWDEMALGYTEAPGLPVLREAIAEAFYTTPSAPSSTSVTADCVSCFAGAEEAIFCVAKTLLTSSADHAIVVTPCYQSHISIAESVCSDVTAVPLVMKDAGSGGGWALDVQAIAASIRPGKTKAIFLNSPHNPTGTAISPADMTAVVTAAAEHGVWVVCDEVYRGIDLTNAAAGGVGMTAAACCLYPRAISIGGLSKPFGMAGLRMGWIALSPDAPTGALAAIADMKHYLSICNAAPAEVLSLIAVRNAGAIWARNAAIAAPNVALFEALVARHPRLLQWCGREHVVGAISFVKLLPAPAGDAAAAGTGLANHRGLSVDQLADELVRRFNILILPGSNFYSGSDGQTSFERYFRVGFGRKDFAEGLQRLEAALHQVFGEAEPKHGQGQA